LITKPFSWLLKKRIDLLTDEEKEDVYKRLNTKKPEK